MPRPPSSASSSSPSCCSAPRSSVPSSRVLRVHPRVDVRPLLLRPSARLVPGAQAPLRRHEAVARGRARRRRPPPPRRSQRARPTPPSWSSAAKAYIGQLRRRARAGLRADARRHRRHLRARHPPLPAPGHASNRRMYGTADRRTASRIADLLELSEDASMTATTTAVSDATEERRQLPPAGARVDPRRTCGAWPTPPADERAQRDRDERRDRRQRDRALQRTLFDGGFAGICFPKEYGGQGLTAAHQRAFNEEVAGYEMPDAAAGADVHHLRRRRMLEFGTRGAEARHLPAILRGDEIWVQFLSEPSGGSDLAGATTRADARRRRVGPQRLEDLEHGRLRTPTTALCLARTNWDVPKHRGLTMFMHRRCTSPASRSPHRADQRRRRSSARSSSTTSSSPPPTVVGEVDDGWTVATRRLFHERNAVGGGSPYVERPRRAEGRRGTETDALIDLVRRTGRADDPYARELIAEAHALGVIHGHLVDRVTAGMRTQKMPPTARLAHPPLPRRERRPPGRDRTRTRRPARDVRPRRARHPRGGRVLPVPPGHPARRRQHRDGTQHHQRTDPRNGPRVAADRDVPFNQVRHGR